MSSDDHKLHFSRLEDHGASAFTRGRAEVKTIERIRESVFLVRAGTRPDDLLSYGTGVLVVHSEKGVGLVATAAHVVMTPNGKLWPYVDVCAEVDGEFRPAEPFVLPKPISGKRDLALVRIDPLPNDASCVELKHKPGREETLLPPGIRVLYAGFPFPIDRSGRSSLVVARGMIGGTITARVADLGTYSQ